MSEGAASYPPRYQAQLETILEIVRRLASEPRLDPLLESIAAETCNLLDAERATLFLYDAATNELYSRVVTEAEVEEIRIPVSDQSIAGAAANTRGDACLNIPDVYADPRIRRVPEVERE